MNNRLLKASKDRPATARSRVVSTLAEEILGNPQTNVFAIESEHQLCRRFNVSRVTVRLALGDLESRGLIFRKHGRGTFAHGHATRSYRNIAVLLPSPQMTEKRAIFDLYRGVHAMVTSMDAASVLISVPPSKWTAEQARALGGIIVLAENITLDDLESLKNRKLPYLILGETHLTGPRILLDTEEFGDHADTEPLSPERDFFTVGRVAAEALSLAALTGKPLGDLVISSHDYSLNLELTST